MATNSKKKAVDAPQDAAVVVSRTRKPTVKTATITPITNAVAKKRAPKVRADIKEALLKDKPAKKVAAKKSVAVKSLKLASPSATPAPSSSTQSVASSAPTSAKQERRVNHDSPIGDKDAMREILNGIIEANSIVGVTNNPPFLDHVVMLVKNALGRTFGASTYERLIRTALSAEQIKARKPLFTGLPAAIERLKLLAAENAVAAAPQNAAEAQAKAAEFNEKVASGELPEGLHAITTTIEPMEICQKLVKAANRVPEGLLRFAQEDRERLAPFISFFERFWTAIPAYFKMEYSFNAKDFGTLHRQPEFASLVPVNTYARFEFACGSRAILLRSAVGCATFFFAENEFISSLKGMKTALPEIIKEQMEKNKPTLSLMTGIPNGLMAMVRDFEPEGRLKLSSLHRIFGDPVLMLMNVPQLNLAHNVQEMQLLLATSPAAV